MNVVLAVHSIVRWLVVIVAVVAVVRNPGHADH